MKESNDNYIFFSYSHMNAAEAKSIIDSLQRAGHSVWYDDGVVPGVSWDDYIAEHIEYCRCFVAYVTEAYKSSSNCFDEINYARDNGKEIVLIYAEDVENVDFPKGLQMRLSSAKILRVSDYDNSYNSPSFFKALFDIEGISASRTGNAVPDVPLRPKKKKRVSSKKSGRRKIPVLLIAFILVIFLFVLGMMHIIDEDTSLSQGKQCTIWEMNYTLPDDGYVQETEHEEAFSNYSKLNIPARERGEEVLEPEDFIDLQWYYGQGNKNVLITAQAASFSNDEFEEAVDTIMLDKVDTIKKFQVGSVNGRCCSESFGFNNTYINTSIQCLNNGVFYNIVFLNTELDEDEINTFIESIDFDAVLDSHTINCGDITLTLPGNYYEVAHEGDDSEQDSRIYMYYTDAVKQVIINYYDSASVGNASEIAEVYADYVKTNITERDESFGKCYCLEFVFEENSIEYSEVAAVFDVSGKTYLVELLSGKPDITIGSIEKILSTIEMNE